MKGVKFDLPEKLQEKKKQINEYKKITDNIYTFDDKLYKNEIEDMYYKAVLLRKDNKINESLKLFKECEKLIVTSNDTKIINIYYEIYVNIALLIDQTYDNFEQIEKYYTFAKNIYPDRSEPYYYFAIYCNRISKFDKAYDLLKNILDIEYENSKKKYPTTAYNCYGEHLYFELSRSCYGLNKINEGVALLNKIKEKEDFIYLKNEITNMLTVMKESNQTQIQQLTPNQTPTLCFITMCKNEEHVIKQTLESVYKYIDYWIICDTGSTDNTCKIIQEFFEEKKIPGKLFVDEWKGFDINKSLMFERAYNITDYILHLDADDLLCGVFNKHILLNNDSDSFYLNYKRGESEFITTSIYKNNLKWKYVGVAHNIIICEDKSHFSISTDLINEDLWVDNNERGTRKYDPNKYLKDGQLLQKQFFDTLLNDPYGINSRSAFYTAQSYFDYGDFITSFKWYNLYSKLKNTWNEEVFESYLRMASCRIHLNHNDNLIENDINNAIKLFNDRAEPYVILANYFLNKKQYDKSYELFSKAKQFNYSIVKKKYKLFINKFNYGKYINDHMAVCCSYINKKHEGRKLIEEIIDDDDFKDHRDRFIENLKYM